LYYDSSRATDFGFGADVVFEWQYDGNRWRIWLHLSGLEVHFWPKIAAYQGILSGSFGENSRSDFISPRQKTTRNGHWHL